MNVRPQEFSGLSIKRVSTAAQVAVAIRNKVLNGELIPGMQLQEIPIAAAAEVSRHTIREAIQILVREGLVRHNVHRGFTVTQLCDVDIDDIYRVRRVLEPDGVRASVRADPGKMKELSSIVEKIKRAVESKDWLRIVASDFLFHRTLVAFLGSQRIDEFFHTLLSELRLGLVLVDRTTFDATRLVTEHVQLLRLLQRGSIGPCIELLNEHLAESERNLREVISSRTDQVSERTPVPAL